MKRIYTERYMFLMTKDLKMRFGEYCKKKNITQSVFIRSLIENALSTAHEVNVEKEYIAGDS